jgi:hypothetical protein
MCTRLTSRKEQVKQAFGRSKPAAVKDWKEENVAMHVRRREHF